MSNPNHAKRHELIDVDGSDDEAVDSPGHHILTGTAAVPTSTPAVDAKFLLPNGEIMNSKNTLQSFDHLVAVRHHQQQQQQQNQQRPD